MVQTTRKCWIYRPMRRFQRRFRNYCRVSSQKVWEWSESFPNNNWTPYFWKNKVLQLHSGSPKQTQDNVWVSADSPDEADSKNAWGITKDLSRTDVQGRTIRKNSVLSERSQGKLLSEAGQSALTELLRVSLLLATKDGGNLKVKKTKSTLQRFAGLGDPKTACFLVS